MGLLQVGLLEPSPPKETYTNAYTHTPITPNFSFGSSCEIVGIMFIIDVGPPLFTMLQPKMPTDGVKIGWCDQHHTHTFLIY
jgi:hypothetical protein